MRTVEEAWKTIINWFEKTKPELLAYLNEGAKESEIADLESHIGRRLPEDLRASLLLYNGSSRIFLYDGYDVSRLLPIAEIKKEYDYRFKFASELKKEMAEDEDEQHFSENDIPVLWFSTGDHSLLNSETGNLYFQSHDGGSGKIFDNFADFLNTVAKNVTTGRFIIGKYGYMTGLTAKELWNNVLEKAKHEYPQICFGEKIESYLRVMIRKAIKSKLGNDFFASLNLDLPAMVNKIYYQTNGQKNEVKWFYFDGEKFALSNVEQSIEKMLDADLTKGLMFPLFRNKTSEIGINLNTHKLYHNSAELDYDLMDLLLNYLNTDN